MITMDCFAVDDRPRVVVLGCSPPGPVARVGNCSDAFFVFCSDLDKLKCIFSNTEINNACYPYELPGSRKYLETRDLGILRQWASRAVQPAVRDGLIDMDESSFMWWSGVARMWC